MSDDQSDIERMVESLRDGSDEVLGDLFERYRPQLRRMVHFRMDPRLRGRIDASDVVQEAYLDMAQQVERFRDQQEMPFVVWSRLMTGQRLIDVHRRHLGAQMRDASQEVSINQPLGAGANTSACMAARLLGSIKSPSQQVMQREQLRRIEDILDRMDPIDREVLALRHFEDLTNNEVAAILNLQKSAASNRYVRALKRLKEIMAHEQL